MVVLSFWMWLFTSCGIEHTSTSTSTSEKAPLVEEQDETIPGLHFALCTVRRLFLSGRRLMSVEQDADSKGGLLQSRGGSCQVSQAGWG